MHQHKSKGVAAYYYRYSIYPQNDLFVKMKILYMIILSTTGNYAMYQMLFALMNVRVSAKK